MHAISGPVATQATNPNENPPHPEYIDLVKERITSLLESGMRYRTQWLNLEMGLETAAQQMAKGKAVTFRNGQSLVQIIYPKPNKQKIM